MTEQEQKEFEKRKKEAENQLNRMYYGSSSRNVNSKGLKMPPFLNTPQTKNQNNHIKESKNEKIPEPNHNKVGQNQITQNKKSGIDLLNLLNFKGIKMDNDRLVIIALCLLLSSEDVDELLLLALMYIMF